GLQAGQAVYIDTQSEVPYSLHFFEMSVRGQTSKGEPVTISAELVAVREEAGGGLRPEDRFSIVPADMLIDLPAHPSPPDAVWPLDLGSATDFLKTTIQMERRGTPPFPFPPPGESRGGRVPPTPLARCAPANYAV